MEGCLLFVTNQYSVITNPQSVISNLKTTQTLNNLKGPAQVI